MESKDVSLIQVILDDDGSFIVSILNHYKRFVCFAPQILHSYICLHLRAFFCLLLYLRYNKKTGNVSLFSPLAGKKRT